MNKKCVFCDIDGTLLYHHGGLKDIEEYEPVLLPGVLDKLKEWKDAGHYLILVTARPNYMEQTTKHHLSLVGIKYDQLIMGVTNYPRVLINDSKPYANMDETCWAYTIPRNKGFKDIKI